MQQRLKAEQMFACSLWQQAAGRFAACRTSICLQNVQAAQLLAGHSPSAKTGINLQLQLIVDLTGSVESGVAPGGPGQPLTGSHWQSFGP